MGELRPVTHEDLPGLRALLLRHVESSVFPLANLATHGLDGHHPRSVSGWCLPDHSALVFVTREGVAMPQAPEAGPDLWRQAAARLAGQSLAGIVGEAGQAAALREACGLADAPHELASHEPGFVLDLSELVLPDMAGFTLSAPGEDDRALLTAWRRAYSLEVLGTPEAEADRRAARDVDGFLAGGRYRLLFEGTRPVAMTGFNAVVDDIVQVGGVYTPPALRGRGLARRAVGAHLAEARSAGAGRAVLFAASDAAARAYRALGFTRKGSYSMFLFAGPQEVRPCR